MPLQAGPCHGYTWRLAVPTLLLLLKPLLHPTVKAGVTPYSHTVAYDHCLAPLGPQGAHTGLR